MVDLRNPEGLTTEQSDLLQYLSGGSTVINTELIGFVAKDRDVELSR